MGIGAGKFRPFVRNDEIEGQGKIVLIVGRNLHIKNYDLDRLYHEFSKHFQSKTDVKVSIEKFFQNYKVKNTIFSNFFFMLYDKTKCGEMDFCHFLLTMWSLMTSNQDHLASLVFALFDTERFGSLDISEINFVINLIWDFKAPSEVTMVLKHLNKNADSIVTVAEFALLVRHYAFLLNPVYELRESFLKKVIFKRFWEELAEKRLEEFSYKGLFEIVDVIDPSFVIAALEYLVIQPSTPKHLIQQWRNRCKQKKSNRRGHVDLPHEYTEPPESKFYELPPESFIQRPKPEVDVNYINSFVSV